MHDHLTRQLDILPPDKTTTPITIIGAGAIGSFVTLSLAKMGFDDITVYDFDSIEVENMNCQFFRFSDIGKKKVEALKDLVKDFTRIEINGIDNVFSSTTKLKYGIVIAAVDKMSVRADIFSACIAHSGVTHFIDPRMSSETALMYTVEPQNERGKKFYKASWYSDDEASADRCTAKSTMYTVLAISSQVCANVKAIVTGNKICKSINWDIGRFDYLSYMEDGSGTR